MADNCKRWLHLIYTVPGNLTTTVNYNYSSDAPANLKNAQFSYRYNGGTNTSLTTECSVNTASTGYPHILQLTFSSVSGNEWESSWTYPTNPDANTTESGGESSKGIIKYWLQNERLGDDFYLPGSTVPITPFAIVGVDNQDLLVNNVRALLGEREPIERWVKENSTEYSLATTTDILSPFGEQKWGENVSTVEQYQGTKIACRISEAALLDYPFCGGARVSQPNRGNQYINLCKNSLGFCGDDSPNCCNCCSIGEKFLNVWKVE